MDRFFRPALAGLSHFRIDPRAPLAKAVFCLAWPAAIAAAAPFAAAVSGDGNRVRLEPRSGPPASRGPARLRLMAGGPGAEVRADRADCARVALRGTLRGRHYVVAEIPEACLDRPLELALEGAPLSLRAGEAAEEADEFERRWLAASFDNYRPETDPGPDPAAFATARPAPAPAALWSDFCGSSPCLRVEVRGEGIQRVTKATLNGFGFPASIPDTSVLRLMHGTTEVALKIVGSFCSTTTCDSNYLEFYGLPHAAAPVAGEWESGDFTSGEPYHLSLVAARGSAPRIADLAVAPVKAYAAVADFPTTLRRAAHDFFAAQGARAGETHFFDQMGSAYLSGTVVNRNFIIAPPSSGPANYDVLFTVPKPSATQPASLALRLTEKPVHLSPYDPGANFRLRVFLNGVSPDLQPPDAAGDAQRTVAMNFPGTALAQSPTAACPAVSGGPLCLTLTPTRLAASGYDEHRIAAVELDYRRTFDVTGENNLLLFTIPNQNARIQLSGITAGTSSAILYELTNPALPRRLVSFGLSAGVLKADVDADAGCGCSTRRFALSYDAAATVPAGQLRAAAAPGLRGSASGAKLLVIYHPDLLNGMATRACAFNSTTTTPWACFLARKRAQLGAANVRTVSIHDVYTDYSSGLLDPNAVNAFLADALATWPTPKPQTVLLLGDGSVDSHDYFNRAGTVEPAFQDWIPIRPFDLTGDTYSGYFMSDAALADANNDGLADLAIGRLPARTPAEAAAMLDKLNTHDAQSFYPYASAKAWMARATIFTDKTVGGYTAFETDGNAWAAGAPAPQQTVRQFYGQPPYNGNTSSSSAAISCALRGVMTGRNCVLSTAIANACAAGNPDYGAGSCQCDAVNGVDAVRSGLLLFDGHGNQFVWGNDGMLTDYPVCRNPGSLPDTDPSLLGGTAAAPFLPAARLMVFNCLSGAFGVIDPTPAGSHVDTVVEKVIKRDYGGVIGGFAPSSITDVGVPGLQMAAAQSLMNGARKIRDWGALVQATRTALTQAPAAQNPAAFGHVDFGDPSQPLRLPAPGPPGAPAATAGNAQVSLAWSNSGLDPATAWVRVWRATGAAFPADSAYAPLACVPATQTAYVDAAVSNTTTYWYALSGFDNYDGAHGNCAGFEGPRTVAASATPVNPGPPAAPATPVVTDPGLGTILNLSFAANSEPDLAYYTLWRGTAPGVYTVGANLGLSLSTVAGGLAEGTRYYFALTATNTSGRTSGYGPAASGVPRQLNGGIRAPGANNSLRISKSGAADLRADWAPVTTDYFGDPLAPPLSGQTLFHVPGAWRFNINLLPAAQKAALGPAAATFTHGGAQTGAGSWAYLVMGSNPAGDGSAGAALPLGITDLRLAKSTLAAGRLDFFFSPVAADTAGTPLPAAPLYWAYRSTGTPVPVDRTGAHAGAVTSLTGAYCESTARWCDDTDLAGTTSYFFSLLAEDARGQSSPY